MSKRTIIIAVVAVICFIAALISCYQDKAPVIIPYDEEAEAKAEAEAKLEAEAKENELKNERKV